MLSLPHVITLGETLKCYEIAPLSFALFLEPGGAFHYISKWQYRINIISHNLNYSIKCLLDYTFIFHFDSSILEQQL